MFSNSKFRRKHHSCDHPTFECAAKDRYRVSVGHGFSKQPVSFWYNAGDTESSGFAADLAEAAGAAGTLQILLPASFVTLKRAAPPGDPIRRDETGVQTIYRDDPSRKLAAAIIHELMVRGFYAARPTDPLFDKNPIPQVWVNVEPRPDGPQGEYELATQKAPAANGQKVRLKTACLFGLRAEFLDCQVVHRSQPTACHSTTTQRMINSLSADPQRTSLHSLSAT